MNSNYIPHKTVKYDNFLEWEHSYFDHLLNMFDIFDNRLQSHQSYDYIDWDNPQTFRNFCNMIYMSSSGNITHNLDTLKNELMYQDYISKLNA
jgi:hypothetical protein